LSMVKSLRCLRWDESVSFSFHFHFQDFQSGARLKLKSSHFVGFCFYVDDDLACARKANFVIRRSREGLLQTLSHVCFSHQATCLDLRTIEGRVTDTHFTRRGCSVLLDHTDTHFTRRGCSVLPDLSIKARFILSFGTVNFLCFASLLRFAFAALNKRSGVTLCNYCFLKGLVWCCVSCVNNNFFRTQNPSKSSTFTPVS
jgi:hypothetical protein